MGPVREEEDAEAEEAVAAAAVAAVVTVSVWTNRGASGEAGARRGVLVGERAGKERRHRTALCGTAEGRTDVALTRTGEALGIT